ncbi:MAG: hypothetical protein PHO74_02495 [Weeksellaceae bacterium]|jgi:hypothetical protein|nr:hypothetical protein [Weeksellaceae bacterium]
MSFFKFLLYFAAAYLIIRFINRLLSPKPSAKRNEMRTDSYDRKTSYERPKFNIEADTVDYEIIEEEKEKDEK